MKTFKAYINKEVTESIRQYRYLILAAGILLFSILDPIMMKLLPNILKNQIKGDISSLIVLTKRSVLQNYIKDLFQIGNIFVIFTFCGTLSDEISSEKFVFPYSKGASPAGIVFAKFINQSFVTIILVILGFSINYYYVNLLFKNDAVPFQGVMIAAALMGLYYTLNIAITILLSSFFKNGIVSGMTALALSYLTVPLAQFKGISLFLPYKLITAANNFSNPSYAALILIFCYLAILLTTASLRMNKIEVI